MIRNKYQTINPIPQFNLGQERTSRILDIIHGKQSKESRSTRQTFTNTFCKNKTLASTTIQQQTTLPCIPQSIRNANIKFNNKQDIEALTRSKDYSLNQTLRISMPIDKTITIPKDRYKQERGISLKLKNKNKIKYERTEEYDTHNAQQQERGYENRGKRQKLMKDYMTNKLRRNKMNKVSEKDRYRMEIESIVGQLTPIEQLQQQQYRMQRVKKKYNHLFHLDKDYYIRLNQHDTLILF